MLQKLSMRLISIALLLLLQIFWRGEVVNSSIIFQLQFVYKAKTSLVCTINLSSICNAKISIDEVKIVVLKIVSVTLKYFSISE